MADWKIDERFTKKYVWRDSQDEYGNHVKVKEKNRYYIGNND